MVFPSHILSQKFESMSKLPYFRNQSVFVGFNIDNIRFQSLLPLDFKFMFERFVDASCYLYSTMVMENRTTSRYYLQLKNCRTIKCQRAS